MRGLHAIKFVVGLFIICGFLALFVLALRVSGFDPWLQHSAIKVTAQFDEIGDLKVRAPVKIAGVRIGEVSKIDLDRKTYQARVTMLIANTDNNIPVDSSASILSASLLGSNYVSISPGFSDQMLKNGAEITETNSAVILENLLGQALFTPKDEEK